MANTLKDRILQRLEVLGKSSRSLSLQVSDNPDLIRGALREDRRSPRADTLQLIAKALTVPEEWLLNGGDMPPVPEDSEESARPARVPTVEVAPAPIELPSRDSMPLDIPVMGTAAGSMAGAFQFEGGIVDYVRRPPGLAGARKAYAIFVTGESMEPLFRHGDLCFVHPNRPVGPGDTVIIQARYRDNGEYEAFIKELVRRTGERILARQYNPASELEFVSQYVQHMHKVLSLRELFAL